MLLTLVEKQLDYPQDFWENILQTGETKMEPSNIKLKKNFRNDRYTDSKA